MQKTRKICLLGGGGREEAKNIQVIGDKREKALNIRYGLDSLTSHLQVEGVNTEK